MTHEQYNGKTPVGGDYSEIYYLDDHGNIVDSSEAKQCVIRECLNDGTLLRETFCKM